ncbi:MAG: hypothetical protein MMC33_004903 [Icmadophila ericetorum]|nr:hypothetical protein [Icmadophila ericetorum]
MAPPKSKDKKATKMGLGEFLTDPSLGSWADEMEDVPLPLVIAGGRSGGYGGDRGFGSGGGYGSGGFNDRGYSVREALPLPSKPPYTVHLGNMSFDATEGDIQEFFSQCSVTSVRIVEDKIDRKPKGFAYAEFATLDGLKKALEFNGTQFQGRNIRVSVAEPPKDRGEQSKDMSDWSRKGPLPDIAGSGRRGSDRAGGFGGDRGDRGDRRDGGGFNRSFDNMSDAGSERPHRRGFEDRAESKVPSGAWERKGPLTPVSPAVNVSRPTSHDGPRERKNSPAWGERSQEGSRPPRRERDFSEKPPVDRTPTAPELDNAWRSGMRADPPPTASPVAPAVSSPSSSSKGLSVPSSPALRGAVPASSGPPASRPKLNLQKRTVSEAEPTLSPASATTDSKASPFGAAKPIDTAAREKEIEEKRQHALTQKKETEEKAREEKRIADEKAKEEKRLAKEVEKAAAPKEKTNGQVKEKENGSEAPSKKYEILRRATNDAEDVDVPENADGENANGVASEDKQVKPREISRDIPKKPNGVESQPTSAVEPTAEALQDDGWSTVSQPKKNRRGGNQSARAIAS